ncbi:hypothetical protein [Martelella soudanensis]|uniref:hypothetical protein n=1 Tax=unclassified Martelella TaxID=2629616 RepID=UPI0015DDC91D|nr:MULTISPECIES: hypothetical protein [unclassified Martelella]
MSLKALLTILVFATPALADEPAQPVREVMAVTENNWAAGSAQYEALFSEDRLSRLFSADFQMRYAEAMETPYAQEAGSPFDYDVVTNAQDGCPLENVTISPPKPVNDVFHVTVRFQAFSCMGEAAEYQTYSTARFSMIQENGATRIDDIVAINPIGLMLSAKEQLQAVIDTGGE